jgi:hypothetical protein
MMGCFCLMSGNTHLHSSHRQLRHSRQRLHQCISLLQLPPPLKVKRHGQLCGHKQPLPPQVRRQLQQL